MKKGHGLKIGVIGVGSMGAHHARICATTSGQQLVAVADANEVRAKEISQKFGADYKTNFHEILPLVDAVIIASPTETHYEVAKACLNANKPCLVEKPLAASADQANELVELAKEKNMLLAVGMVERFNPAYKELQRLVRKEKIIGIHACRFSPLPTRITDANVIQDMMIHDLDLVMNLLPHDEIEELQAEGSKVETKKLDRVTAKIFLLSGIIARVEADRVFGIKTRKIIVTTERVMYEADLLNKKVLVRDFQHHLPSIHHVKQQDQLTAELQDFVNALKENKKPVVDGASGLAAIKLAEEVENKCS